MLDISDELTRPSCVTFAANTDAASDMATLASGTSICSAILVAANLNTAFFELLDSATFLRFIDAAGGRDWSCCDCWIFGTTIGYVPP